MVAFIGEDGFYPKWCTGPGRWVQQRVFTTVRGMMEEWDELARPAVSHEALLWAPPRGGLRSLFAPVRRGVEVQRALLELQAIRLTCVNDDWSGYDPRIQAYEWSVAPALTNEGPATWRLRCPECGALVGHELAGLDAESIVQHWVSAGRPNLERAGAATSIKSTLPIRDLAEWLDSAQPMENELAYVGQQLWPDFRSFIEAVQAADYL